MERRYDSQYVHTQEEEPGTKDFMYNSEGGGLRYEDIASETGYHKTDEESALSPGEESHFIDTHNYFSGGACKSPPRKGIGKENSYIAITEESCPDEIP